LSPAERTVLHLIVKTLTSWFEGDEKMNAVTITLEPQEIQRLEAIIMDKNKEEALDFLKTVIRAKIRTQGNRGLDSQKGTGVPL